MACNTPIIASFDTDSDLADVINDAGIGCCVEPGNSKALADAIIFAYNNRNVQTKQNSRLRDYVTNTASKDICVQKYIEVLNSAIRSRTLDGE